MKQIVDIPTIKAAVPMQAVLEAYGIKVQRGTALCPFHSDKHPSMKVYKDGYYCFSCGNGGDAIKFVARMESISNAQAAVRVAAIGGVILPEDDYRGQLRARQMAQERRKVEQAQQAKEARYRTACNELHSLQRLYAITEPYGDTWCYVVRQINKLEVELDELFEQLGA